MAHYARVHTLSGQVVTVIVADEEFLSTYEHPIPGEWIQTSYNTRGGIYYTPNTNTPDPDQSKALRKNFATIGGLYLSEHDMFVINKPFPSWILNLETGSWEAPVARPEDNNSYLWSETEQKWNLVS